MKEREIALSHGSTVPLRFQRTRTVDGVGSSRHSFLERIIFRNVNRYLYFFFSIVRLNIILIDCQENPG